MVRVAPPPTPASPPAAPRPPRPQKRVRFAADAAGERADGNATLASQLQLSPPEGFAGTLRPAPPYPRVAALGSWLFNPDPMQRPWGVSLQPSGQERYVLLAPERVGRAPTAAVRAHAVVGFGLGLGPTAALSVLALTLLLPEAIVGRVPKVALAALTALALGFAPRANFVHHTLMASTAELSPAELEAAARRRNGWLQWALVAANLDGLRRLPEPFFGDGAGVIPAPGEVVGEASATAHAWGLSVVATLSVLPGSWLRHSWLRQQSHAATLTVARPSGDRVELLLCQTLAQPWHASIDEGLLWGTAHAGSGHQTVQVTRMEVAATAAAVAGPLAALEAAAADHVPPTGLSPTAEVVTEVEEVHSHGSGWRWPWPLPYFKSFGVGHVRQRFVLQRRASAAGPAQLALGVVGMNEGTNAGRLYWEVRIRHVARPAGAGRTPPLRGVARPPGGSVVSLQVYMPWSSPRRRQELIAALACPAFVEPPPQAATMGWRRDLFVHLSLPIQGGALDEVVAGFASGGHDGGDGGPAWEGAYGRVTEFVQRLRRAAGLEDAAADGVAQAPNEALLDVLAASGLGFLHLLGRSATPSATLEVSAGYGQTQQLLQDAGWHLAAWPEGGPNAMPLGWRRRAENLIEALQKERAALLACPFVQASPAKLQGPNQHALLELAGRLAERLQPTQSANLAAGLPAPVTHRGPPSWVRRTTRSAAAATHLDGEVARARPAGSVLAWAKFRPASNTADERTPLLGGERDAAPRAGTRPFFDRNDAADANDAV